MTKVSKNIKELRKERNMTQDELAQKLFVTRQAVSSWENDRTQPDIFMLGKIREVFGVSIEELLYGKKRNTSIETEKPDYTSTLITVFSVLGAILVGAGLIMVFIFSWEKLPDFFKGALCFVPMLMGQAAGVFVLSKKQNKKAWLEGGAILWMTGIVSSSFLCFSFFPFRIDDSILLGVITLMILPVMLLTKSVSSLPVFYGFGFCFTIFFADEHNEHINDLWYIYLIIALLLTAVIFAIGIYFTEFLKNEDPKDFSHSIAEWFTAIAFPVVSAFFLMFFDSYIVDDNSLIYWLSSISLAYLIFSQKSKDGFSAFKALGFIGTAALSGYYGIAFEVADSSFVGDNTFSIFMLGLVPIALSAFSVRFKFRSELQLIRALVFLLMQTAFIFFPSAVLTFLSLIFFALMIAEGAMSKKLLPMNTGFIGFLFLITCWIIESDLDIIYIGLILILCGAGLLGANVAITKSKKNSSQQNEEGLQ